MFRKLALVWVIAVLPLAGVLFGCGEDESVSGPVDENGDEVISEWDVTVQTSGVEVTLQGVFFVSDPGDPTASYGWVVGNEGVVLHTTDNGETWEQQDSGVTGTLYSICFVDADEGWAVGDGGTVVHTADGGATWELQNSGITERLRGSFFANSSEGWAVGEGGVVINTRDGGVAWNSQKPANQDLMAVHFAPPDPGEVVIDHGWAVGVNGTIIYTTDAGGRWRAQPVKDLTEPLYGVFFDDKNKGWVVGKEGTVLRTSNGGETWGRSAAAAARLEDRVASLYDVFFIHAADGWSVGSSCKLLHSPDGRTWEAVENEITKGIKATMWGVAFIDSSEGWAVGDAGTILHIKLK
jgi:photosystem II stability/assembly factor-like uncharacterized protein